MRSKANEVLFPADPVGNEAEAQEKMRVWEEEEARQSKVNLLYIDAKGEKVYFKRERDGKSAPKSQMPLEKRQDKYRQYYEVIKKDQEEEVRLKRERNDIQFDWNNMSGNEMFDRILKLGLSNSKDTAALMEEANKFIKLNMNLVSIGKE